ncbi:MAG: type I DNA topoisomerase [Candidatus Omnitrophica bacterium]|nr:type I DNA topoisomerase [Candidatus Omnitrophota bacterium]
MMGAKSLVIVESAAKAKTINKFLGNKYKVCSSMGHLIDLPKSKMGIDIEKDFEPHYIVIQNRKKILSELKKEVKDKEDIYLASDPDREGEAISWHLSNVLGDGKKFHRVVFYEITKKAIEEAFSHPRDIDLNKVNAQQARRILDRIVGYNLSPLLWKKVGRGLSAGRVQTVAVRLIVEREREIKAFVPEEYWEIEAELEKKIGGEGSGFIAKLEKINDKKAKIGNKEGTDTILLDLESKEFVVKDIKEKEKKKNPVPPFTTSKMQQEAFNKLRFSASKTMRTAQQLYEGLEIGKEGNVGLITYMRTDSVRISDEALTMARGYIDKKYGKEFLPEKPNVYKSGKSAQGAHEAVRPTYVSMEPDSIKEELTADQYRLYKLIWERFVSSQMSPARYFVTTVEIEAGQYLFKATGSKLIFPGWIILYNYAKEKDDEDKALPPLTKNEALKLLRLIPSQHWTEPPPRYSEATLVKALEEKGIGRPSTYAPILETIAKRDYVQKEGGYLSPTELGIIVTDLLIKFFPVQLDVRFTAGMEEELDKIEEGKADWIASLKAFYSPFVERLDHARDEMKSIKSEAIPTEEVCEKCGKQMVIRWSSMGKFLGCSGFPECKNIKSIEETPTGEIKIREEEVTDEVCDKCGKQMVVKWGRNGKFISCSGYPDCKNAKSISTGKKCPEEGCGGDLVQRRARGRRFFYGCSNYPTCKYTVNSLQ